MEALTNEQLLESILNRAIQTELFGRKYSSLGHSHKIMKLTLQDVQKKHEQQFTLENIVLFSHGDLSPLEHISNIT